MPETLLQYPEGTILERAYEQVEDWDGFIEECLERFETVVDDTEDHE